MRINGNITSVQDTENQIRPISMYFSMHFTLVSHIVANPRLITYNHTLSEIHVLFSCLGNTNILLTNHCDLE